MSTAFRIVFWLAVLSLFFGVALGYGSRVVPAAHSTVVSCATGEEVNDQCSRT